MMDLDAVLSQPSPVLLPSSPIDSGVFLRSTVRTPKIPKPLQTKLPTILPTDTKPRKWQKNQRPLTKRELERKANRILRLDGFFENRKEVLDCSDKLVPLKGCAAVRRMAAPEAPEFDPILDQPDPVWNPHSLDRTTFEVALLEPRELIARATTYDLKPNVLQKTLGHVLLLTSASPLKTEVLVTCAFLLEKCLAVPEHGGVHLDEIIEMLDLISQEVSEASRVRVERQRYIKEIETIQREKGPHTLEDLKDAKFALMEFGERCEKEREERLKMFHLLLSSLTTPTDSTVSVDLGRVTYHPAPKTPIVERRF